MTQTQKSYGYINDFLYFVLRPDNGNNTNTLIYCSGVNINRFSPLTSGRHGIGSHPAVRGLQLVNFGVRDRALSQGATPRRLRGNDCAGIAPTAEDWYTELLIIDHAPESFPDEMITFAVLNLLQKIFTACMLDVALPDTLPKPHMLQAFLENLCSGQKR